MIVLEILIIMITHMLAVKLPICPEALKLPTGNQTTHRNTNFKPVTDFKVLSRATDSLDCRTYLGQFAYGFDLSDTSHGSF